MDENLHHNGMWSRGANLCRIILDPYTVVPLIFFFILLIGINTYWIPPSFTNSYDTKNCTSTINYSLNCTNASIPVSPAAPANHSFVSPSCRIGEQSERSCPDYFRWIYEDLKPWKDTGISRDMLESSKEFAHFRLVILKGKVYLEKYKPAFQTRDVFTIWGILQLVKLYPGQVPDLELMFNCNDTPSILKSNYAVTSVPPLFHYCNTNSTLDIVFPDWSFWGWPEVNLRPWEFTSNAIREGNKETEWKEREPYAFWKGNPYVHKRRIELMRCNNTDQYDWNARLYKQNWTAEERKGFMSSNVSRQCTHRYKIYIEGNTWSVSSKYIMGCDSMTLLVKPEYYDFFMRGLVPLKHYWPVRRTEQCRDIKFAVEWGNNHTEIAQYIGHEGSNFIHENVKMENVYDYMFHLLREYAKLLKFKPVIPPEAVEICSETFSCTADIKSMDYMSESMVKHPSDTPPCTMSPPFDPASLEASLEENEEELKQVAKWEGKYWENIEKTF